MQERAAPGRLPPADWLVTFEAAARHGSFTRAAAERHVTQSAVSRQVAQLEGLLGVALFRRRHRAIALTADGQRLAAALGQALGLLRGALAEIRATERREVLALTTTPGLASLWLIPRLADFLSSHPGIDVRIDATLEKRALAPDGFDLAIRYVSVSDPPGPLLFSEALQPVCSPALLRDPARPLTCPSDLRRHLLLKTASAEHTPMPAGMPNEWQSWLASAGVPGLEPAGWLVFNQFDAAVAAALAGQGVLLGRRPIVDALLGRGELVTPFAGELASARGYVIVVEPASARRPSVQALRGWLLAQAAGAAPAAVA